MLKVHSHPFSVKWSRRVSSLNTNFRNLEAALKVLPLSEMNLRGSPLRAANHLRHQIKVSVDMSRTMSRCTALVTRQVNKQMYTFLVVALPSVRTSNGPAKSTPVKLNAGSSLTLLIGSGGGGSAGNGRPSNLRQVTHQWVILRTKLLPFTIQNFLLTSVRVSRTPLCSTRLCASLTIRGVTGCLGGSRRGYLVK